MTKLVLEQAGYRVVLASDGAEALLAFTRQASNIHAVLADVIMPGMDGVALAQIIRRMAPALKIVMVTGMIDPAQREALVRVNVSAILNKPISKRKLLQALRNVLDGASTPPIH